MKLKLFFKQGPRDADSDESDKGEKKNKGMRLMEIARRFERRVM